MKCPLMCPSSVEIRDNETPTDWNSTGIGSLHELGAVLRGSRVCPSVSEGSGGLVAPARLARGRFTPESAHLRIHPSLPLRVQICLVWRREVSMRNPRCADRLIGSRRCARALSDCTFLLQLHPPSRAHSLILQLSESAVARCPDRPALFGRSQARLNRAKRCPRCSHAHASHHTPRFRKLSDSAASGRSPPELATAHCMPTARPLQAQVSHGLDGDRAAVSAAPIHGELAPAARIRGRGLRLPSSVWLPHHCEA